MQPQNPSHATATAGHSLSTQHPFTQNGLFNFNVDPLPGRRTPVPSPLVVGAAGLVAGNDHRSRPGSLGAGVKRPRVDPQKSVKPGGPGNLKKKAVTGTSVTNGRKMRAPPADIFVWGMHPDTSPVVRVPSHGNRFLFDIV